MLSQFFFLHPTPHLFVSSSYFFVIVGLFSFFFLHRDFSQSSYEFGTVNGNVNVNVNVYLFNFHAAWRVISWKFLSLKSKLMGASRMLKIQRNIFHTNLLNFCFWLHNEYFSFVSLGSLFIYSFFLFSHQFCLCTPSKCLFCV